MDAEWEKLRKKTCWLEEKVREYDDVANEARKNNAKVHFGRIFEICSQKGSELPDGDPNKKWKGRSVFQGNRVHDEHHDHALFAELGYRDPVCPLRLALYGHPDAGPTKNMAQGWKDINSVIDMDPPEALGRYFGWGEAKFDWWTGRTYFPLDRETPVEDFTYALASYKKKNPRSKTEAKNKVKESRFKPPESIIDEPTPCMVNKVNAVTYDMEDFLGTCVEKYCELAKVDRKTLRHAATPFHEARIAKPVDPDKEPTGKLAGIASRILMKVLFAARV
ncbi:cof, partial [Symbiodinium pilosum]